MLFGVGNKVSGCLSPGTARFQRAGATVHDRYIADGNLLKQARWKRAVTGALLTFYHPVIKSLIRNQADISEVSHDNISVSG